MSGEKLYRIKIKANAHISEKLKEGGSRAALQFDQENNLQGPVDLIEVDESEYPTKEIYIREEQKERTFGQVIWEDIIAPTMTDTLTIILTRAVDAGVDILGNWMSQKVIPAAKEKRGKLEDKTRKPTIAKKVNKTSQINSIVAEKKESNTVIHTQEEVDQILNNMKLAALYIAAGIRELTNTIISDDGSDSEKIIEVQSKLKELSSEDIKQTIEFMLQDQNRDMLDQTTVQLFEAFRNKDLIVNGETVSISKYLSTEASEV